MKVLILGSGGRESALAWKLSLSPSVHEIVVSPGNGGIDRVSLKVKSLDLTRSQMLAMKPDLVVVGPEQLLAEGVADYFDLHNVLVVGPSKAATQLESSKAFCKEVLVNAGIPTSRYCVVEGLEEALRQLETWPQQQVVVKVDGLAQGKGVVVCETKAEAHTALKGFFNGNYLGYQVDKVLLEEKVTGVECSAFALCTGEDFVFLGTAVDHKRLLDGDKGPNTGGMGALSPAPFVSVDDERWICDRVFAPALRQMKTQGTPFRGFLFAGLMKTETEGFSVLEFNTRMGDPETQALLPRMDEDLFPWLLKAAKNELDSDHIKLKSQVALHLVMAAEGYPGVDGASIRRGDVITVKTLGIESLFFPAGIARVNGQLLTNGGRVCGLTVLAPSIREARQKMYQEVNQVTFPGMQFRRDLAARWT